MIFKFRKQTMVAGGQFRSKRRSLKDEHVPWLQKLGHNVCLMSGCIIMQKTDALAFCFGAAIFEVVLLFS